MSIESSAESSGVVIISARHPTVARFSPTQRRGIGAIQRCIIVEVKIRNKHQLLSLGNLPLQATTQFQRMIIWVREVIVMYRILLRHGRIVPAVNIVIILGIQVVIEDATLELCTATTTPAVRIIECKNLGRGDTLLRVDRELARAIISIRCTLDGHTLIRKILLIEVIGQCHNRHSCIIPENIDRATERIFIFRGNILHCIRLVTATQMHLSKEAMFHALASDDIDNLTAFTIINTRNLSRLAQSIIDLDMFDRLRRNTLQNLLYISAKHLLSIDIYLLNLLTVCLNLAIGYSYTGHLAQQRLNLGIDGNLECICIIA